MKHDDYVDRRTKEFRNVTTYEVYHRALDYGGATIDRRMPEAKLTHFQLNDEPARIEVRVIVNAVDIDHIPDLVARVTEQYTNDH